MPALIDAEERQRVQRAGKVAVGAEVDSATAAVVQAYARAWQLVRDDLLDAASLAEVQAIASGRPDDPAAYRTARLTQALERLSVLLGRAGELTGVVVRDAVPPLVAIPAEVMGTLADSVERAGLYGGAVGRVSTDELDAIVRRTTQAITSATRPLSDDAQQQLRTALVRATATGQGPRQAARELIRSTSTPLVRGGIGEAVVANAREGFAGGMTRAMTIVRTELIDASRQATTATYLAAGDLVTGWQWVSAGGPRTCPACWAMHGQVFAPDVHQDGHQQCRCTQVPILAGEQPDDTGTPDRDALFRAMPKAAQLQAIGPQRLAYLDAGGAWDDLVEQRDNRGWRSSRVPTPLTSLVAS